MQITIFALKPTYHPFPLFSWAIRLFQNKEYSHFASTCEYDPRALDATGDGVKLTDTTLFFSRYKIVKSWDLEIDVTREQWVGWYSMQIGKKYSYLQNAGYILQSLGFKNPFGQDAKKLVCSELQALQLSLGGYNLEDSDSYDLIKTEKLIEEIKCS